MYTEIVHSNIINLPARISCGSNSQSSDEPERYPGQIISSMHLHDELELLVPTHGKFGVNINNRTYILGVGDAILIKSRVPHETFVKEPKALADMLQFTPDALLNNDTIASGRYLSRFINSSEPYIFKKSDTITTEAIGYVKAITHELEKKDSAYDMYIKANLYMLLACFYRHGILNNADTLFEHRETKKIMPILTHIDVHFREQITLETAADILKFNPDYFCRLFKKATGMTFTDYLNFVRICQAENELIFSDKSIGDISLDCGFSSTSYFNRVFKKFKLISPSAYRNSKYMQK